MRATAAVLLFAAAVHGAALPADVNSASTLVNAAGAAGTGCKDPLVCELTNSDTRPPCCPPVEGGNAGTPPPPPPPANGNTGVTPPPANGNTGTPPPPPTAEGGAGGPPKGNGGGGPPKGNGGGPPKGNEGGGPPKGNEGGGPPKGNGGGPPKGNEGGGPPKGNGGGPPKGNDDYPPKGGDDYPPKGDDYYVPDPPKTYPHGSSDYDDHSYGGDDHSYDGKYDTDSHPYPNGYPAKYGQPENKGEEYAPKDYSKPKKDYSFEYPSHGEHVKCDEDHDIKYQLPGKKYDIDLVYGKGGDDCHDYMPVARDCENTGSYGWKPPKSLPPTGGNYGYGYKFTCKETGDVYYTPQFCFENKDFYKEYKHPACPTTPPPTKHEETPAAETPCPTTPAEVPVASTPPPPAEVPQVATNVTSPPPPVYTGAASSLKATFSFVAGLAVLVAFAL